MIALQITNLKTFMSELLSGETFDIFLLQEAAITMNNLFTIDGRVQKNFTPDAPYEYTPWKDIKGTCFYLIKGKQTPLNMQYVFQLLPTHLHRILEKEDMLHYEEVLKAFILTVRYDGEKAILYTGCAYHTFFPDKQPEKIWDEAIQHYLIKKEIACELL